MTPPALSVLSWNIRKAVGTDRRRDPDRIMRLLRDFAPDIVFLQEADKRLPPRRSAIPRTLLEEAELTPVPVPGAGIGWHGNALLLGDRVKLRDIDPLDLPGLEPRGALLAELDTPLGEIVVGGLHLGLTRGARRSQLAHLRDRLERYEAPALLAGDLNEWSRSRGFEPLDDSFDVHAPGPSFHARAPRLALDRIVTRGPLRIASSDVPSGPELRRASDHLPIRARIERD